MSAVISETWFRWYNRSYWSWASKQAEWLLRNMR